VREAGQVLASLSLVRYEQESPLFVNGLVNVILCNKGISRCGWGHRLTDDPKLFLCVRQFDLSALLEYLKCVRPLEDTFFDRVKFLRLLR
jgi:hypothetical protein